MGKSFFILFFLQIGLNNSHGQNMGCCLKMNMLECTVFSFSWEPTEGGTLLGTICLKGHFY